MDTIKVGAFLKELRKGHGLSQEQLADKFNVIKIGLTLGERQHNA